MPVFKQTHQKKLTEKKIQKKKKTSSMGMLFVSKWWCPHCHFTTTNQCPISIPTLTTTGPQSTVSILLYHFLKLITESLIFIFTSCITVSDHHYFHLTSTQLGDGAVGQTMSGKCFSWFSSFPSNMDDTWLFCKTALSSFLLCSIFAIFNADDTFSWCFSFPFHFLKHMDYTWHPCCYIPHVFSPSYLNE